MLSEQIKTPLDPSSSSCFSFVSKSEAEEERRPCSACVSSAAGGFIGALRLGSCWVEEVETPARTSFGSPGAVLAISLSKEEWRLCCACVSLAGGFNGDLPWWEEIAAEPHL